jgi:protoporphyrinogen oxidase
VPRAKDASVSARLPRVVVLGAGPAGAGGALQLRRLGRAEVTLLEQQPVPGGNAGSFDFAGQRVDFGSHRLHPATDPAILADIQALLGPDLLDRPRHGRIGLRGRWIHFPLKPVDLMLRLDPGFALGALRDAISKPLRAPPSEDSFAEVLRAALGPTICESFYFPYARKIWGRDPGELSGIQARRRVSAGSFGKLVRKVLAAVPGFKPPGAGRFWYPRNGYGQITERYAEEAVSHGAAVLFGRRVTRLVPPGNDDAPWRIVAEHGGAVQEHEADHLWSTIPLPLVARLIGDGVPAEVLEAAGALQYRGMILVYLELPVSQFTEFDAHYFPGADVRITRLSEPKNYAAQGRPAGTTVLCAELPSGPDDPWWNDDDAALARLVMDDLARAGVPVPAAPRSVLVRRLKQAYPIYLRGYERHFDALDRWAEALPRFLSYGRQGLFAHDNTHHALAMAYAAAECLQPGGFDRARWAGHRREFERHVVED